MTVIQAASGLTSGAATGASSSGSSQDYPAVSMIWIQADGTTDIPTNAVAYSNQSVVPPGYSAYTSGINAYLRGANPGISYVGAQVGAFAGQTTDLTVTMTSLTGGLAAAPAAGDLVVVSFAVGSTANRSLVIRNTGGVDYTLIGSELYADDTFDTNLRVAYRFMPDTTETQFVLVGGSGNVADAGAYIIQVFRGVDLDNPLDVAAVTATGINSRLANPGSITPVTTGAYVVAVGAAGCGTGGTFTHATLTDFRATTQVDTNDVNIGAGYTAWGGGALDPAAFGGGGTDTTNDSWAAVTFALNPGVTDGGVTIAAGTHTHTYSHTHTHSTAGHTHSPFAGLSTTGTLASQAGSGVTLDGGTHNSASTNSATHTASASGSDASTSGTGTSDPPFYKLQTVQASSAGPAPFGIIGLWKTTTPPNGWAACDGTNGTPNINGSGQFIKGANGTGEIGTTGAATHTHTGTAHTHTGNTGIGVHSISLGADSSGWTSQTGASNFATHNHTHADFNTGAAQGSMASNSFTYSGDATIDPRNTAMFFIMSLGFGHLLGLPQHKTYRALMARSYD
jgi:hypothetical protein